MGVSAFLVTLYLIIVFNIIPSKSIFCLVLGYLGYFTSIAMFCWMTVFCFDLCRTFCTSTSPNSRRTKTFIIYSASAWGTALAFTTTIMALDIFLPEVSDFKPNIGHSTCFIEDKESKQMIYFYIPVTLFVLLNLGLYLATVVRLSMHNRQTRIVRQSRRLNAGTGNDESVFGKD